MNTATPGLTDLRPPESSATGTASPALFDQPAFAFGPLTRPSMELEVEELDVTQFPIITSPEATPPPPLGQSGDTMETDDQSQAVSTQLTLFEPTQTIQSPASQAITSQSDSPPPSKRQKSSSHIPLVGPVFNASGPLSYLNPPRLASLVEHTHLIISAHDQSLIWHTVENVLYCLPRFVVIRNSEALSDIFNIPMENSVNGPSNPVNIPQVTSKHWDSYLYETSRLGNPTAVSYVDKWAGVLLVSSRFFNKLARTKAIRKLEWTVPSTNFRHAFKLYIAREAGIEDWLRPTFRALIKMDGLCFTPDDTTYLESRNSTLLTLMKVKMTITTHRAQLGLKPQTPAHGTHCDKATRKACITAWITAWRNFMTFFAGGIDQETSEPIQEQALYIAMREAMPPKRPIEMGKCWDLSIERLNDSGFFDVESLMIEQGVDLLMAL